ncbi:MAG: DUF3303 domain-containing protein [Xanthomonadales bacterium]|jgi:hypothetical protein|nr:DUF3303 domain-containing protein [Xanthomonadales bacterium]
MKFMVTWRIEQDKWLPILKKWSAMKPKERADAGKGVKIIGRWHDQARRGGVGIFEATDLAALSRYLGQWNPYMDMEIAPVLDDEESAAAAKSIVADNRA